MFLLQPPSINWFSSTAQPIQQPPKPNTPIWSRAQGGKYCRHTVSALTLIGAFMQMYHLYGDGSWIYLSFIRDHLCSSFFTMLPHANRKSEQWRNNFRIFISLYFTLRQVKKYDVISPSSDTLIRSWGVGWEACWAWLCFVNGLKQQWWWREFPSSLIPTTNSHLPQDTQMLWYLKYAGL